MRFIVLVTGLLISIPAVLSAEIGPEWREIAESNNGTIYYIRESDFINDINFNPKVWFVQDHSKDRTVSHRMTRVQMEFRCKSSEYRVAYRAEYRADGTLLSSGAGSNYSFYPVIPDTVAESMARAACPIGSSF